jgi:hypothetical protein
MNDEAKLQMIPKKNILIIFCSVAVYALLFTSIAFLINKAGNASSQTPKQSLANWKIVGILLSLYTLTTPWRWQEKIIARINQHNANTRPVLGMLILFCFAPLIAPLIYGLVLFILGLSFVEFCYFVALSIVGASAWSIYNLRKIS